MIKNKPKVAAVTRKPLQDLQDTNDNIPDTHRDNVLATIIPFKSQQLQETVLNETGFASDFVSNKLDKHVSNFNLDKHLTEESASDLVHDLIVTNSNKKRKVDDLALARGKRPPISKDLRVVVDKATNVAMTESDEFVKAVESSVYKAPTGMVFVPMRELQVLSVKKMKKILSKTKRFSDGHK